MNFESRGTRYCGPSPFVRPEAARRSRVVENHRWQLAAVVVLVLVLPPFLVPAGAEPFEELPGMPLPPSRRSHPSRNRVRWTSASSASTTCTAIWNLSPTGPVGQREASPTWTRTSPSGSGPIPAVPSASTPGTWSAARPSPRVTSTAAAPRRVRGREACHPSLRRDGRTTHRRRGTRAPLNPERFPHNSRGRTRRRGPPLPGSGPELSCPRWPVVG